MKIRRDSWHARIYQWWYMEKYHRPCGQAVNLCPYVRAVLFWAHMRALFRTRLGYVTYPLIAASLEYLLYRAAGFDGLKMEAAIIAIAVAGCTVVAILIGTCLGIGWLFNKIKGVATQEGTFVQVLVARQKAAHSRICPLMEFED